jgi:hypothetical protein
MPIKALLDVERREGIAMLQRAQEWAFDEASHHKNKASLAANTNQKLNVTIVLQT